MTDQDGLLRHLTRVKASLLKDDYERFFKEFWPVVAQEELVYNWHIGFIAAELEKVGRWIINREPKHYDLLINVPPGTSKSKLTSVLFHPWLWANMPECRIITGSHTGTLMVRHSSESKDIIKSDQYQAYFPYIDIKKDFDSKYYYKNTLGGERLNTSAGSNITGSHAHLIIIDDPIDAKGARSSLKMQSASDWVDKTLATRKVEKANTPTIMIMQRLAEEDPSGVWLEAMEKDGRKVRHICFPGEDNYPIYPPEAAQYYKDGLLDPNRMGRKTLDDFLKTLGTMDYAGQFGQSPKADGGNIIKEKMLPILEWGQFPKEARDVTVDFAIDSSDKEKKENDPTGVLAYLTFGGYIFILDYISIKARFSKRIKAIVEFVKKYGSANSQIFIEPKSSGVAMYQYLADTMGLLALEWQMAEGDKVRRAKAITPFLEQHKVWLLRGAWNERFIEQCTGFPNLKHDEEVDVLVMSVTNGLVRGDGGNYNLYE